MPRAGKLDEVLKVSGSDSKDIGLMKRRRFLERIAQVGLPTFSAIAGLLAGNALYPVRERIQDSYPYGPLMMSAPLVAASGRRSWTATVIVSLILFGFAFAFISWINAGVNDSFGPTSKYGVYCRNR